MVIRLTGLAKDDEYVRERYLKGRSGIGGRVQKGKGEWGKRLDGRSYRKSFKNPLTGIDFVKKDPKLTPKDMSYYKNFDEETPTSSLNIRRFNVLLRTKGIVVNGYGTWNDGYLVTKWLSSNDSIEPLPESLERRMNEYHREEEKKNQRLKDAFKQNLNIWSIKDFQKARAENSARK